jgi:phosphatidate cytidylyltransferase
MLQTRLWVGTILVLLTVGMLVLDRHVSPWYPFLFAVVLGLSLAGCAELLSLLDVTRRPNSLLCYAALTALVVSNWLPHVLPISPVQPWLWIAGTFAGIVVSVFLVEMATFREPGGSVVRMALTVWIVAYLGLLPSFLAQLRWLGNERGTAAVALAIFVPKCCDIGAYFTGRLLGRHKMTPVLSPKKTWEGAAGGLLAAVAVAVSIDQLVASPPLRGSWLLEATFGVSLGVAGMLGDLGESLIKRDCRQKDASQAVPGFGGILDVVDAVIFAGPVAYAWITWFG